MTRSRIAFRCLSGVLLLACMSTGNWVLAAVYAGLWAFEEGQR